MKLLISGLAGVVVACIIFTAVIVSPWSGLITSPTSSSSDSGFPQLPPGWPSGPLGVQVSISNLTDPLGVGSEGEMTIVVASKHDVSDVTAQFELLRVVDELPIGIVYTQGNLANITWMGDLRANVSVIFNAKMKAVEVGYARIRVTAIWYPFEGFHYEATDSIWILIQENSIQISHEPITPPGVIVAESGNGTLPLWP